MQLGIQSSIYLGFTLFFIHTTKRSDYTKTNFELFARNREGKPRQSQIWRLQSDQDIGIVILSHQLTDSGPWKAKHRNYQF